MSCLRCMLISLLVWHFSRYCWA